MSVPYTARVRSDAFGREPRDYGELRRLAARYARDHLAGLALTNHATQLAITLAPEALAAAAKPGAPAALLRAIPELPSLLSHALYVRTIADRQRRPEVRRLHLLSATAEIAGRLVELLFTVRENVNGQCFLDRVAAHGAPREHRDSGGAISDATAAPAPVTDDAASPELDIFVGGAGDEANNIVKPYQVGYAGKTGRDTKYFSWEDMDGILDAIRQAPPGTKVNVIGHSYGAHTAALGIGMMAPTGIHVDKFISIDPVGRSPIPDTLRGAVGTWVNVSSAPQESDRSDFIAMLGGKGGHLPVDQADINYNVATNHGNFAGMMDRAGPQGVSARQILLGGTSP